MHTFLAATEPIHIIRKIQTQNCIDRREMPRKSLDKHEIVLIAYQYIKLVYEK